MEVTELPSEPGANGAVAARRLCAHGSRRLPRTVNGGHMSHKFEIYVTDWAPELTTSEAISPPRLPDTTEGPTAEMRLKHEVIETTVPV